MAKYLLRQQAREMRRKGTSVRTIAQELGISKGSASIWVRDIVLTIEQLENLRKASIVGAGRGRLKSAFLQKERWKKQLEEHKKTGYNVIGELTKRELLIAGLALYWGEGYKKGRRLQLCNSDPMLIKFYLEWLTRCFKISKEEIRCRLGINILHKEREEKVRKYWSDTTGLPLSQFTTTSFKLVNNLKVYDNLDNHFGTLSIEVIQPSRYYGKIIGLLEGLSGARIIS